MKKAQYKINPQPTLVKLLEMVRDDVREMDGLSSPRMVSKADVIQIINDWIGLCLEEWPPISQYRKKP